MTETFLDAFPGYAATRRLDDLRTTEYDRLDTDGHVYLDYTGSGLAPRSQLRRHHDRLAGQCFGNPHSANPTSSAASALVEETRRTVLRFFNASPEEYVVIFTANATGACKLVGESYPFRRGTRLVLLIDNHNSVNGIREFARARGARVEYVPIGPPELRADEADVRAALARGRRRGLFVYPAQSNFTGVQHPLEWVELAQRHGYDVLLDAAAFVPANRLDLSEVHPDFVPVSWYKVFGYPTGVGCLLARRTALARLHRPWFAGGTIQVVSAQGGWHVLSADESAFEDGTLNFLAIPDVRDGIDWISGLGVGLVHERVSCLTGWLLQGLVALRHTGGAPMIRVYGPLGTERRGGTVTFNILDPQGRVLDERIVERDAAALGISIRTGCFCNPGAGEAAFSISQRLLLRQSVHTRRRTLDEYLGVLGLPSGGAIRASLGLVSNQQDVERFLAFLTDHYRDRTPDPRGLDPRERC